MTLSVVVTLTSLARAIVAPLLAAYIVAPLLAAYFSRFFIYIITSMFYHLLSVTCCGMSSRLIIKRRYTYTLISTPPSHLYTILSSLPSFLILFSHYSVHLMFAIFVKSSRVCV